MLTNSFIPIFIPNLHNYLLNKFNVNIYNIPIDDWHRLICDNYCKNIINNTYCIKKYKKDINDDNSLFCSKCCERKGIKRKRVYKKKTKIILNNDDSDSGVYTESDDKKSNTNYKPTEFKLFKNKNYNKIDLDNVYLYINNKQIEENKKYVKDVLNSNKENKHKYIMFGTLKVNINENAKINDYNDKNNLKRKTFGRNLCYSPIFLNNKKYDNGLKYLKENDFTDINSDLYYVFTYIIYLIFKTSNIKIIQDELHNYLGDLGVQYYISQYIKLNNNDLIY
jgi:hypothetical protein